MTEFQHYWITGFNVGFEWARGEDDGCEAFIIDLGILRLLWITYFTAA
jgi:hypothetical protein